MEDSIRDVGAPYPTTFTEITPMFKLAEYGITWRKSITLKVLPLDHTPNCNEKSFWDIKLDTETVLHRTGKDQ